MSEEARSRKQAMLAKCHECMGKYVDGKQDCQIRQCPLYQWMPYRELDPDLTWAQFNPRRMGQVPVGTEEETEE